ncbi:MAG: redoxin domain-containing protein [Deltaproteobacteria bacterium]|nr:redoxin domain-containing protein [Deltaproteobacteria bacterium]
MKELPRARVALVLCQSRDNVAAFFDADRPPFAVLCDETRDVARAYGVHQLLGFDAFNIARPATFVIDRTAVVRFVFVASHQFENPDDDAVEHAALSWAAQGP